MLGGVLGAILGLGGGVIMLPALEMLLHYDAAMMVGTTMLAVVFTSAGGAWGHFRNGNVLWREGLIVGGGGLLGMVLGSWIFKHYMSSDTNLIFVLLGILFLFMTLKMGREAWQEWSAKGETAAVLDESPTLSAGRVAALMLLGLLTGIFSGMLGVGGGWILVPGIIMIARLSPHKAVGTTMLAMLPIAILGASIKLAQGFVVWPDGLFLGLGALIGAQLGARVSNRIPSKVMKLLFSVLFLLLAVKYIL
ncbi:MAG: sulfite exporter TauE/SafE family protein [Syntrophomonadaceae bacterium]|nr:sulfite exporter TauE/SafE family protein [Syntrophomonadaceae bacterium]